MMKELEPDTKYLATLSDGSSDNINDVGAPSSSSKVCELNIKGMMCSACSGTIERGLNSVDGVHTASIQLLLESAHVCFDSAVITADQIAEEVEDLGFDCSVTSIMDASASTEDLVVLNIYGTYVPAEAFGSGVRSSCQLGLRQYCVKYSAKLIGARTLIAKAREIDPLAEVDTRQIKVNSGMDDLLRDFFIALPSSIAVFYLCMLAPKSVTDHLTFLVFPGLHFFTVILLCLVTPVQFISGKRFHLGAYRAIVNRNPNMEVLISVATNLAYFFSLCSTLFAVGAALFAGVKCDQPPPHFFEAPTTLICVMLLGKSIEGRAKSRTAKSLDRLMDLTPEVAHLTQQAQTPEEGMMLKSEGKNKKCEDIPVALVELGDELVLYPGERIPCDGTLVDGSITVDESLLTGESTAVKKHSGDRLIGGSMCVSGTCTLVVDCLGHKTIVNQIVTLIEHAQRTRAPVQVAADRIGRVFVPIVLVIAFATTVVWACLIGTGCVHNGNRHFEGHLFGNAEDCLFALKFGLSVLLVACPCALGLATPTAVMVASSVAADNGILVKSIVPLEATRKIKAVVMDKTGTLTRGVPQVTGCVLLDNALWSKLPNSDCAVVKGNFSTRLFPSSSSLNAEGARNSFWSIVASAESGSEHPLARAMINACRKDMVSPGKDFVNGVRGIDARVGELPVRIGSEAFVREKVADCRVFKSLADWALGMQDGGCTVVYVCVSGILLGAIAVEDNVAPGALETVQRLQARGVKVAMCTGDAAPTAHAVAHSLYIEKDMVFSEVLPQDKVRTVSEMQKKYGKTLMIGDGLNDAAALGQADVGVAIGCGAQISVQAADVVLARSDIIDLVSLVSLADETIRTVYRNFAFSFVFNATLVPIAAGVLYPFGVSLNPMVAGLCMAASSISVISSSLMLRRWTPVKRQQRVQRLRASVVGNKSVRAVWSRLGPEDDFASRTDSPSSGCELSEDVSMRKLDF